MNVLPSKGAVRSGALLTMLFVLVFIGDPDFSAHFLPAASADSEASSEAGLEAGITGGRRGRRWAYMNQMRQQHQAQQRMLKQQQLQNRQAHNFNHAGSAKPFRKSDYIHEYGRGRNHRNYNNQSNSLGTASGASSASNASNGIQSGNLNSGSSVPFQSFPPK